MFMRTHHLSDIEIETLEPALPSLRVAMVTETYPPEINGVSLSVAQMVRCLRERGHSIQLVRPRQNTPVPTALAMSPSEDEFLVRGMVIPRYSHLQMGLPAKRSLERLWLQRRPDVVHIATEGPLGWSALKAALKLRIPVSTDFRTNFDAYSAHYGLGWLRRPIAGYLRKFHNQGAFTTVPTIESCTLLEESGFERLQIVPRGIDTQQFHPNLRSEELRKHWGARSGQTVVLHVGRLAPEKNLDLLARTLTHIAAHAPDVIQVVVGDGPASHKLAQACPQARMVGSLRGSALCAAYASADVFLFPSVTETYGNVTPEALASGLALLAFRHAAAAELIVDGFNGVCVEVDSPELFVQKALALVRDPIGIAQLRKNARASIEARDWHSVVHMLETLWRGLLPSVSPLQAVSAKPPASLAKWGQPLTT